MGTINKINRCGNEGIMFYVTPNLNRFVALYEGLAYWFMMKDQYLFQVTTEKDFFKYISDDDTPDKMRYTPTNTGFVSLKGLLTKRRFYMTHPVNKEGMERRGIDLLLQAYCEED